MIVFFFIKEKIKNSKNTWAKKLGKQVQYGIEIILREFSVHNIRITFANDLQVMKMPDGFIQIEYNHLLPLGWAIPIVMFALEYPDIVFVCE